MNTVTSDKNLIVWDQNRNGSNIYVSSLNGNKFFLKEHYANVFKQIANQLHEKQKTKFLKIWITTCNKEIKTVKKRLITILKNNNVNFKTDDIDKVINKFRGNLGEILIEMFAENGLLDFIKPGSYNTVDPTNEQYIDADAIRNGLPVGIQIKNYDAHNRNNRISRTTFNKAAAMSDLWLRRDKLIADEDILDFIKTPCQYIISTVNPENEMLLDDYKSSVVFLGPSWFESKNIHGNDKTCEMSKWKMFDEVAKLIEKIS